MGGPLQILPGCRQSPASLMGSGPYCAPAGWTRLPGRGRRARLLPCQAEAACSVCRRGPPGGAAPERNRPPLPGPATGLVLRVDQAGDRGAAGWVGWVDGLMGWCTARQEPRGRLAWHAGSTGGLARPSSSSGKRVALRAYRAPPPPAATPSCDDAQPFCAQLPMARVRLPSLMVPRCAGPDDAKPFCAHYYVKDGGNCDLSARRHAGRRPPASHGGRCRRRRRRGGRRPSSGTPVAACRACHQPASAALLPPASAALPFHPPLVPLRAATLTRSLAGSTCSSRARWGWGGRVALPPGRQPPQATAWPRRVPALPGWCRAPARLAGPRRPKGPSAGQPCCVQSLAETARAAGRSEAETAALLAACREKLFNARKQRPRPHRDEKARRGGGQGLTPCRGLNRLAGLRVARAAAGPALQGSAAYQATPNARLRPAWPTPRTACGHVIATRLPPAPTHWRPTPSATAPAQIVAAWNGMAMSALAVASRALAAQRPPPRRAFPAEARPPREYLEAALKVRQSGALSSVTWAARLALLRAGLCWPPTPPRCGPPLPGPGPAGGGLCAGSTQGSAGCLVRLNRAVDTPAGGGLCAGAPVGRGRPPPAPRLHLGPVGGARLRRRLCVCDPGGWVLRALGWGQAALEGAACDRRPCVAAPGGSCQTRPLVPTLRPAPRRTLLSPAQGLLDLHAATGDVAHLQVWGSGGTPTMPSRQGALAAKGGQSCGRPVQACAPPGCRH